MDVFRHRISAQVRGFNLCIEKDGTAGAVRDTYDTPGDPFWKRPGPRINEP